MVLVLVCKMSVCIIFSSAVLYGSGVFQILTRPSAAATFRGGGGGNQSQKRFSNFFIFLGLRFLWGDINNMSYEGLD